MYVENTISKSYPQIICPEKLKKKISNIEKKISSRKTFAISRLIFYTRLSPRSQHGSCHRKPKKLWKCFLYRVCLYFFNTCTMKIVEKATSVYLKPGAVNATILSELKFSFRFLLQSGSKAGSFSNHTKVKSMGILRILCIFRATEIVKCEKWLTSLYSSSPEKRKLRGDLTAAYNFLIRSRGGAELMSASWWQQQDPRKYLCKREHNNRSFLKALGFFRQVIS